MTLPDPLRGYAAPTWDTRTLQALIAALGGAGTGAPSASHNHDSAYSGIFHNHDDLYGRGARVGLTSDQSVGNTTLTDTALALPVNANTFYGFDSWLYYNASPAGKFRCELTGPSGIGGGACMLSPYNSATPVAGSGRVNYVDFGAFTPIGSQFWGQGDQQYPGSVFVGVIFRGYVKTGGSSGTVRLRFSQGNADALATTLKTGSWLQLFPFA